MPPHSPSLPATTPAEAADPPPRATAPPLASELSPAEQANLLLVHGRDAAHKHRAAEILARLHWKPMVRNAQFRGGLSRHDAEDAVQETFARFLKPRKGVVEVAEAYLFVSYTRCCHSIRGHNRRQRLRHVWLDSAPDGDAEGPAFELPDELATTDPLLVAQWRRILPVVLETILAQTPARMQVMLLVAQGWRDADIAAQLGISEEAVGDRKYRARRVLREIHRELYEDTLQ